MIFWDRAQREARHASSTSLVIFWEHDHLPSSSYHEVEKLICVEKLGCHGHLSCPLLELTMLGIINKKAPFSLENHWLFPGQNKFCLIFLE